MTRITKAVLESKIASLNYVVGDGDTFYLSCAYGRYSLRQNAPGGGEVDPLHSGYLSPRDLAARIDALRIGYNFSQQRAYGIQQAIASGG